MTSEDSEKIRELYEIYEQPMFRIAYAVLHDSALAEDAVSDAFIRIIGKLDRLKAPDSPKTKQYIVKTIKSTSINIYRKNRRWNCQEMCSRRIPKILDRQESGGVMRDLF